MTKDLTSGNPFRVIIAYMIPVFFSLLLQSCYSLADTIIVGQTLGADALGGVSSTSSLGAMTIGACFGLCGGFAIPIANAFGAADYRQLRRCVANGAYLCAAACLILMVLCVPNTRAMLTITKTPAENFPHALAYLYIAFLGVPCRMLYNYCAAIVLSLGDSKMPLVFLGIAAVVNIVLDLLFVGVLGWGVAGAAAATVFGQFCGAMVALSLHLKYNKEIHLSFKGFKPNGHVISTILGVGVPSIIMASIGSVMTYSMNRILNGFTSTAVAVFGVYFKLQSFIFMPVFGLNNAIVPIIAYNFGARRPDRMKKTIKLACVVAMSIMFTGFLLLQLIPQVFLGFFDASADMLAIGVPALRTISIAFLAAGACIIIGSTFQALGKGIYSMFVSIARQLVVLVPVAWLLSKTGNLNAVWWSFPIAEIMGAAVTAYFFLHINKTIIKPLEQ